MKKILLIIVMMISSSIMGKDKETFSQADVDKMVKIEVERQVNLIKKKSITQITKELLQKERDLNKKSKQLDHRSEQLSVNETAFLKRIEDFQGVKSKIIGCLDKNKQSEALRIKQLVSVISNMKPLKAAELLSVQESNISVKLIERIDPAKASKIFNLMDKEVSARLQKQYLNMQQ